MSIRKTLVELNVMPSSRILVGVSGGIDSMVLIAALHELGYATTAAHVNFQLRGKDSDDDALLVKKWCQDHDIPFLEQTVDTKQYAALHKLNTQSAAREIRYNWWNSLMESNTYDFIATAHHFDDNIETFLLNILRGTGIKGLRGIPPQREYFIRPLINVSRFEIEAFSNEYDIPFRTDQSNMSDAYQRNKIRHHLIPFLKEFNPDLDSVMRHMFQRIGLELKAWDFNYEEWQKKNIIQENGNYQLQTGKEEFAFLLKWLEEKGIPWSLAFDFVSSAQAGSGKFLDYEEFRLSRTHHGYYLERKQLPINIRIEQPGTFQIGKDEITIEKVPVEYYKETLDPWMEYADFNGIQWPLELSVVLAGDHFQPLGMMGRSKKIQDYLVDLKLDQHQKDQVRILKSGNTIIWLVGMRLDERVKVKPGSKEIFRLYYKRG